MTGRGHGLPGHGKGPCVSAGGPVASAERSGWQGGLRAWPGDIACGASSRLPVRVGQSAQLCWRRAQGHSREPCFSGSGGRRHRCHTLLLARSLLLHAAGWCPASPAAHPTRAVSPCTCLAPRGWILHMQRAF